MWNHRDLARTEGVAADRTRCYDVLLHMYTVSQDTGFASSEDGPAGDGEYLNSDVSTSKLVDVSRQHTHRRNVTVEGW